MPSILLEKLQSRFPEADTDRLTSLAECWDDELGHIIKCMLDISQNEVSVLPQDVKHEVAFELALLIDFIADRIIEKKLTFTAFDEIDIDEERSWLTSRECAERIEGTAKVVADNIWIKLLHKWWRKYPIATSSRPQTARKKITKYNRDGVRRQHFSPSFSNKHWANERHKVRVYSRTVDGSVKVETRKVASWAREDFIYSQSLESLFAGIESDAGEPYKKLLNMIPLSEEERRCWIAFLVAQLFRTPSFILNHLPKLKQIIERDEIDYATDIASLRRAYETLFTNDYVFESYYKLICGHEWETWLTPHTGGGFIRGDAPVVMGGSTKNNTWRLVYPMTPAKCFVSGPIQCAIPDVAIPRKRTLEAQELREVNILMAQRCRRGAIGVVNRDDTELFRTAFQNEPPKSTTDVQASIEEYWGRIC